MDAIDSTFVSSVGEYVNRFEQDLAAFTGAARAVATVNGTCALQVALRLVGVESTDEVITQPLTFAATANAIAHLGAARYLWMWTRLHGPQPGCAGNLAQGKCSV